MPIARELTRLAELVRVLRERCPWDREQTHHSLVQHLLEETYEAMEAIELLGDDPAGAPPWPSTFPKSSGTCSAR